MLPSQQVVWQTALSVETVLPAFLLIACSDLSLIPPVYSGLSLYAHPAAMLWREMVDAGSLDRRYSVVSVTACALVQYRLFQGVVSLAVLALLAEELADSSHAQKAGLDWVVGL